MSPRKHLNSFSFSEIGTTYRNIIVVFSVLAAVLVILIIYFAFSQAKIFLTPKYTNQTVGFVIPIINQEKTDELSTSSTEKIPGNFQEIYLEESKEFPASTTEVSQGKASGKITIYNDYSTAQPLIATTRFQTPAGLIFRLPEGVTVPAKGKLEVTVIADQEGKNYEVGASKFILPALSQWRQQYVYAESFEPMTIQLVKKTVITQDEIDKAIAKFKIELLLKAKEKLIQEIDNQNLAENFITSETIKSSSSEKPGSNKESFKITLGLKVRALIVSQEKLRQQAISFLPETYQQTGWLVKIDNQNFNYEVIPLANNTENLIAQVKGEFTVSTAWLEIDKNQLKGLSKNQAKNYLKNLSDVSDVQIQLPFWTNYLPSLTNNITLEIKK